MTPALLRDAVARAIASCEDGAHGDMAEAAISTAIPILREHFARIALCARASSDAYADGKRDKGIWAAAAAIRTDEWPLYQTTTCKEAV